MGNDNDFYNDFFLKGVTVDGQTLNFTYNLADGSEKIVGVDTSDFDDCADFNFLNEVKKADSDLAKKNRLTMPYVETPEPISIPNTTDNISSEISYDKTSDMSYYVSSKYFTRKNGNYEYKITYDTDSIPLAIRDNNLSYNCFDCDKIESLEDLFKSREEHLYMIDSKSIKKELIDLLNEFNDVKAKLQVYELKNKEKKA